MTPDGNSSAPDHATRRHRLPSALVVGLGLLALWDLRIELQLLLQHFTLAALRNAIAAHPLAVAVLLLLPRLQRRLR